MGRRLCLLLLTACLVGCGSEPARFVLVDELHTLQQEPLQRSAQPFLESGASVAVMLVQKGGAAAVPDRLAAQGFAETGRVVTVYVSLEPHYSELRAGRFLAELMPARELEQVRQTALNPALQQGSYQAGLESALNQTFAIYHTNRRWKRAIGALVGFSLGGWLLLLVAQTIHNAFYDSAPMKLARRLWAWTPMGWWQRQRGREKDRLWLLERVRSHASALDGVVTSVPILSDSQRAEIADYARRAQAAAPLSLEEVTALNLEGNDKDAVYKELADAYRRCERSFREASESLKTIHAYLGPSKKRKQKARQVLTPYGQARLDELRLEFDRLQARRAELGRLGVASLAELVELAQEQEKLDAELRELRQNEMPGANRPGASDTTTAGSDSSSSWTPSPSSASEERTDFYSGSSSGGDSVAGGDW